MTNHISDAVKQADQFAIDIIQSKKPVTPPTSNESVVYHDHYYHFWNSGSCSNETCHGSSEKSKTAIVTLAAIVILAASYFIGMEAATRIDASDKKQVALTQKALVMSSQDPAKEKALEVLDLQGQMLDSIKSQTTIGLAMKTALVATAAVMGLGAFYDATPLLLTGAAAGSVAAGALLFRWGYSDSDTSLEENANRLHKMALKV